MRRAVFYALGITLALVATDQVIATAKPNGAWSAPSVNRAAKSDRAAMPSHRSPSTSPSRAEPDARPVAKMPEGCETAVSPLAKSAIHAPMARCLS